MRPVETIPGIRERDKGGVNSTMIHCKNICNVTVYP
jgi:hypothetical protein